MTGVADAPPAPLVAFDGVEAGGALPFLLLLSQEVLRDGGGVNIIARKLLAAV